MGKSVSPDKGKTTKFSVVTPVFLRYEIEDLVGIYEPSRSEVITFILTSWFHDNEEKIEKRKAKYTAYRTSRAKRLR